MKQCARNSITTLAILALAGSANASVVALGNGLATLFTDNIDAGGPSTAVTVMEQALLDHINGAATSIDLAIYDFNRASVREALIAAHNRGVTVRAVSDNDATLTTTCITLPWKPLVFPLSMTAVPQPYNKFFVIDGK